MPKDCWVNHFLKATWCDHGCAMYYWPITGKSIISAVYQYPWNFSNIYWLKSINESKWKPFTFINSKGTTFANSDTVSNFCTLHLSLSYRWAAKKLTSKHKNVNYWLILPVSAISAKKSISCVPTVKSSFLFLWVFLFLYPLHCY